MNYLLNAPFILDFSVTLVLFGLCFITVIGIKVIIYSIKDLFPKTKTPTCEQVQPIRKRKKARRKTLSPVRSIEINPDEIDKIYVKKIS